MLYSQRRPIVASGISHCARAPIRRWSRPATTCGATSVEVAATMARAVRRYTDDVADYQAVLDITKHIYGGSDYIPRVIKDLANDPSVLTLVCNLPEAEAEQGLSGLVCGQRRDPGYYLLFGLRVADAARGKGVGTLLLSEVCRRHTEVGPCTHLVGVTTPNQPDSMRIFDKLGFRLQHQCNSWPPFSLLRSFEKLIGFPQADYADAAVPSMLDWMPGVREHLQQDAEAQQLQQQWQQCSSLEQLQQAVAYIRREQHEHQPPLEQGASTAGLPWDWLPWVYDIAPCASSQVQQLLQEEGGVWLLRGPSDGSTSYQGVLITGRAKEFRRQVAGILATSSSAVLSAVSLMGRQHKHFVTFVDLVGPATGALAAPAAAASAAGAVPAGGAAVGAAAATAAGVAAPHLALYDITGGHGSYYVYHKPASSVLQG